MKDVWVRSTMPPGSVYRMNNEGTYTQRCTSTLCLHGFGSVLFQKRSNFLVWQALSPHRQPPEASLGDTLVAERMDSELATHYIHFTLHSLSHFVSQNEVSKHFTWNFVNWCGPQPTLLSGLDENTNTSGRQRLVASPHDRYQTKCEEGTKANKM
jgi:hypothetical protein